MLTITNETSGIKFNVITKTIDGKLMAEFYDDRFKKKGFDPVFGQFVSRYLVETLLEDSARTDTYGLNLQGSVPDWMIEPTQMRDVNDYLRKAIGKKARVGATIELEGDTWEIINLGTIVDDKIYAHLASTTRFFTQKNGKVAVQKLELIPNT
jgi:hypothetical protein